AEPRASQVVRPPPRPLGGLPAKVPGRARPEARHPAASQGSPPALDRHAALRDARHDEEPRRGAARPLGKAKDPLVPMTPEDLHALMNRLLEAERAGAKLLAAYLRELQPGSELHARLDAVQRDEARNCAVLIHHLLECGAVPRAATGDFYERGLAIREWS